MTAPDDRSELVAMLLEQVKRSQTAGRRLVCIEIREACAILAALQPPEPLPVLGFCKECSGPVRKSDEIAGHPGVYDCPNCGHPNGTDELFEVETTPPAPPDAAAKAQEMAAWVRSMTNNGERGLSLNSEGVRRVISLAEEDGNLRERLTNSLEREIRGDLHRERLAAECERLNNTNGFEVAAEWRDKFKKSEADRDRLAAEVERLLATAKMMLTGFDWDALAPAPAAGAGGGE